MNAHTQEVTIPVPDSILTTLNMGAAELAHSMREEFALKAFGAQKLTLAQAAAFCSVSIYEFIVMASRAGLPIIDYSIEEVNRELAALNACG
jgi:predicted HTH domain antitoxin